MNKFKFEKLIIWQKAMDSGEMIHQIAMNFPKEEIYNLSSQIRRASDSIALNITEGSIGQTNPEQIRFMGYAIRSLAEGITCLYKAKNREYVNDDTFNQAYENAYTLMNLMIGFKNKLK